MLQTHIPISTPDHLLLRPGTAQIICHERSATLRYCPDSSWVTVDRLCLDADEAREFCHDRGIRVLA